MSERATQARLAVAAFASWVVGALFARRFGLWVGIGPVSVALGVAALVLDGGALRALLRPSAARVVRGLAVGAAMTALTYALYPLFVRVVPAGALETRRLYVVFSSLPPAAAALLLLPVIAGEELVWRGVVQGALARRVGPVAGVLVGAAVYAAAHAAAGSLLLVVVALGCGVVWGTLRAVGDDLVAPLIAHVVWDVSLLLVHPLVR